MGVLDQIRDLFGAFHLDPKDICTPLSRNRHYSVISTNGHHPNAEIFPHVRALTQAGRAHTLCILCHGYAGENEAARVCIDAGGGGLQLGRDDLTHDTVKRWAAIKGCAKNIVVYSCAAASTLSGSEFTAQDGEYLMGALSVVTGSTVYAATQVQWYDPTTFDFKDWEGKLLKFEPSGAPPDRAIAPPVPIAKVLAGDAR